MQKTQLNAPLAVSISTSRVTRRFEKNHPIFQKEAQTASKSKKANISVAKLNLKPQNIYINSLLKH
jgi:hypothetical protein